MGQTPDRFPGVAVEEGVDFEPGAAVPGQNGAVRYVAGQGFRFFEEGELKGLGGAPSPPKYKEFGYTGERLTEIHAWMDSTKVVPVFTRTFTYTGDLLTQVDTAYVGGDTVRKILTYDLSGKLIGVGEFIL